ncbi:MAG: hypothetical protein KGD65_09885 [Candidatus Lokiarchaeota archaeon]|nr:hypothetical protein [Candidatus Lokiarchaeota archaeon]
MGNIERNYSILEKHLINQMEISLNYGHSLIESELDAGILNVIVRPIVKSFYKYWSDKDARVGTLEQINLSLNSARVLVTNGELSEEQFDNIININFPKYLENDQTDRQCKKDHRNYKTLKDVSKKLFTSQVEGCILFLKVKEDIKDYADLSRAAFKTREDAYQALIRQLDYNEEGIQVVEKDDSILKIPKIAKKIILKILRKGFELTKTQLIEELDEIYNNMNL